MSGDFYFEANNRGADGLARLHRTREFSSDLTSCALSLLAVEMRPELDMVFLAREHKATVTVYRDGLFRCSGGVLRNFYISKVFLSEIQKRLFMSKFDAFSDIFH